jgi:pimeloyl-ACP methyl ester carboxylesterase
VANVATSWRARYAVDNTYRTTPPDGVLPPGGALILRPTRRPDTPSQVVFWNHGVGANADQVMTSNTANQSFLLGAARLCDAGMTVISLDGGTPDAAVNLTPTGGAIHWGNPYHYVPHVRSWVQWCRTQPDLAANKVAIIGASMGGYGALSYAKHHREDVGCVITDAGVASIIRFRQRVLDTWPTYNPVILPPTWGIAEAWGVTDNTGAGYAGSGKLPADANLIGGYLDGLPLLSYYSTDDPTADESWMRDLHADVGPSAVMVATGAFQHQPPPGGQFDADRTVSFIRRFTQ